MRREIHQDCPNGKEDTKHIYNSDHGTVYLQYSFYDTSKYFVTIEEKYCINCGKEFK